METLPATLPAQPQQIVDLLQSAWQAGYWPLVAALVIMLVVWALRFVATAFARQIPPRALPWISAAAGVLAAVATSLATVDGVPLGTAILYGLVTGLASCGLWSALGRHAKRKKKEAPVG